MSLYTLYSAKVCKDWAVGAEASYGARESIGYIFSFHSDRIPLAERKMMSEVRTRIEVKREGK
jgi:hypothetical protein